MQNNNTHRITIHELLDNIKLRQHELTPTKALDEFLKFRYENAKRDQTIKGVDFQLTLDEFMSLVTPWKRNRLAKKIDSGNIDGFLRSNSGYVLSWKSREALASRVMNKDTAVFVNREESRRNQHLGKGDTHSEKSKQKISQSKTGVKASDEAKKNMSIAKTGHEVDAATRQKISAGLSGTKNDEATKQRKSEAAKARWAAYRKAKGDE